MRSTPSSQSGLFAQLFQGGAAFLRIILAKAEKKWPLIPVEGLGGLAAKIHQQRRRVDPRGRLAAARAVEERAFHPRCRTLLGELDAAFFYRPDHIVFDLWTLRGFFQ